MPTTDTDKDKEKFIFNAQIYRLTEQIWGNCETAPEATPADENDGVTNRIIVNYDASNKDNPNNAHETLLSWFARNTKTADAWDSCRDTTCPENTKSYNGQCLPTSVFAASGEYCTDGKFEVFIKEEPDKPALTNCCTPSNLIGNHVCCKDGIVTESKFETNTNYAETKDANNTQPAVCTPQATTPEATPAFSTKTHDYFCVNGTLTYTSGEITCDQGYFVAVTTGNETNVPRHIHYLPTARNNNQNYTDEDKYNRNGNNFYYEKGAISYQDGTTPVLDDRTKYIFDNIEAASPGVNATDGWYPADNQNPNSYKPAGAMIYRQLNGWNVTFPLLNQKSQ